VPRGALGDPYAAPVSTAGVLERVRAHARARGTVQVLAECLRWGSAWAAGRVRRPAPVAFVHEGQEHQQLHHPYNWTWLDERAVEVPLARAVLAAAPPGARVLEIGNVLGHYGPVAHTVVDKYERAPGVVNDDVATLPLDGGYDLVLAISTLEHVGQDEADGDPTKAVAAVHRLAGALRPGGRLWVTVPVGYNAALEAALLDGAVGVTSLTALREGAGRRWAQVPVEEVRGTAYDWLFYRARAVLVAEVVRPV